MNAKSKSSLEECGRCGVEYPPEILSSMIGALIQSPVCGICALAMRNAIHGDNRQQFSEGSHAEWNRLEAIDWRERHRAAGLSPAPKAEP